jgi:hypothetical protein
MMQYRKREEEKGKIKTQKSKIPDYIRDAV